MKENSRQIDSDIANLIGWTGAKIFKDFEAYGIPPGKKIPDPIPEFDSTLFKPIPLFSSDANIIVKLALQIANEKSLNFYIYFNGVDGSIDTNVKSIFGGGVWWVNHDPDNFALQLARTVRHVLSNLDKPDRGTTSSDYRKED